MSLRAFLRNQQPPRDTPDDPIAAQLWTLRAASGDSLDEVRRWHLVERFEEPDADEAVRRAEQDYLYAPSWLPRPGDMVRLAPMAPNARAIAVYTFQERDGALRALRAPPMPSAWRRAGTSVDDEGGRWAASLGPDWTACLDQYNGSYHGASWLVLGMNLGFTHEVAGAVHAALALLSGALAQPHPAWDAVLAMFEAHSTEGAQYTPEEWTAALANLNAESDPARPAEGAPSAAASLAYRAANDAVVEVLAEGDLRYVLEWVAQGLAAQRPDDARASPDEGRRGNHHELMLLAHRHLPLARMLARLVGEQTLSVRYDFDAALCELNVRFQREAFEADLRSEDPARSQPAAQFLARMNATPGLRGADRVAEYARTLPLRVARDLSRWTGLRAVPAPDGAPLAVWLRAPTALSAYRFARLFDAEGRLQRAAPYVESYGATFFPMGPGAPGWSTPSAGYGEGERAGDLRAWAEWHKQQRLRGFVRRRTAQPP